MSAKLALDRPIDLNFEQTPLQQNAGMALYMTFVVVVVRVHPVPGRQCNHIPPVRRNGNIRI